MSEARGPATEKDAVPPTMSRAGPATDPPTITPVQSGPEFPSLHYSWNPLTVICYIIFLLFFNLAAPCLLFYLLKRFTDFTTKELIGVSSASLGFSSCFDAPFRLYRLLKYKKRLGPLGSDNKWHLDFFMWTIGISLLIFAIPLAVAPAVGAFKFFLMSTVMLVGPVGLVFSVSLFAPALPFRCSSDKSGTRMKPAAFYLIEDIAAVDFGNGQEYRRQLNKRYAVSPPFRRLMYHITLFFSFAVAVYAGITAAVTWNASLDFAFGYVLGQLFIWAFVVAAGCFILARWGLYVERRWLEQGSMAEASLVNTVAAGEKTLGTRE